MQRLECKRAIRQHKARHCRVSAGASVHPKVYRPKASSIIVVSKGESGEPSILRGVSSTKLAARIKDDEELYII